jgi:hypothetical protein
MSTADSDIYRGREVHVRLTREEEFGVYPSYRNWQCIPLGPKGWKLRSTRRWFIPDAPRDIGLPGLLLPRGMLRAPAHPEVARFLLKAALDRPSPDELHSYCAECLTPAGTRRCLGLTADTMVFSAADDPARITLRMRGHHETTGIQLAWDDFDYQLASPAPFSLRGARLNINGADRLAVSGFTLRVENELRTGPNEGNRTAYLLAAPRRVSVVLRGLHGDDTLQHALCAGKAVEFSADFSHPAGHSMTIHAPRLLPRRREPAAPPAGLARREVGLAAAEDPNAGYDIDWSVNLAAENTTT